MYISLYRRYRPQTFSDMVGQSAAVGVLLESLREGTLGHAYLFSGPRGCGKTSAARLVAKSLDCLNRGPDCEPCGECENCRAIAAGEHLDVIEIDGASNRGIGEIRDLKSHVSLKALAGSYKVYIIDEVHMLTDAAFNALLKTLEEPPENVVFLLATTEPHKVPVTIRSRCQHIPFHRITIADTVSRLRYVCSKENITADDEAIWELARQADGALRDALSLTEQAVALGRGSLTLESVRELTGGSSRTELEKWVTALRTSPQQAACNLQSIMSRGISSERLCESLFVLFRDMWLYSLWKDKALDALETSSAERDYLASESPQWESSKLRAACALLGRLLPRTHYGMKGDIFSGLIFMELRDIIEGNAHPAYSANVTHEAQPQSTPASYSFTRVAQSVPAPETAEQKQSAPAAETHAAPTIPARKTETPPAKRRTKTSSFATIEQVPDETPAIDVAALCAKLGDNDFSRLVGALRTDHLTIAAALLNAKLLRRDGQLEIEFERPMPAKNFLSAERNRREVVLAAAKLWGVAAPEVEEQEETTTEEKAPPAPAEPPVVARPEEKPAPTHTVMSNVLRRVGAEVLYVNNVHANNEEENEENE